MTLQDMPALNACLNGASTVLLALGYWQIRKGNRQAHRNCMVGALVTSTLFLACYLTYHELMRRQTGQGHTSFQNPAWFRPIYLTILFTHLVGAVAMVPMILMTVWRAFKGDFERHRRIARWTWPIWMYVSFTGVVIYFLLYQIFRQTS
jgi:uncharacterized membrane protein YozB (DUF420 family)